MTPFPLGQQWPTTDPFLFVAHHLDHYPAGNDRLGPQAKLDGRRIGNDFAEIDGWNMYHGSVVPGFPQHPHRGFETVTYLRSGYVDHADSLGATARYGPGDTQWLTAGGGIVHSEMFPLLSGDNDNPLELFQIWLNLPRATKMADPCFSMMWREQTPQVVVADGNATSPSGGDSVLTVVAGTVDQYQGQTPPPDSWASQPGSDLAILHLELQPGHTWSLPPVEAATVRTVYFYRGAQISLRSSSGEQIIDAGNGVELAADEVELTASGSSALAMILEGRPIGEPVAQYGPFVLNDRAGLEQALHDYQQTQFGGWPWDRDDPVHPVDAGRFALRPDGQREVPAAAKTS